MVLSLVYGFGKSFFAKQEMGNVFLNTQDDVIVIDPMNEYFDIADTFGGAIVNLSAYTKNYVNPLAADLAHMNERVFVMWSQISQNSC